MKNVPHELADANNVLARSLETHPSGKPKEWDVSFRTGHFARITLVDSTEEKRHQYELFAPAPSFNLAIQKKPLDRRSTIPFKADSPSGMIRALFKILKEYAPDE